MTKDMRSHFRGCLLGAAVGDALGGPVEFMDARAIERKHKRVTEMIGGGWLKLAPGQYTDDTQMMLALAESLVERDAFDADDIASRFVSWLESNPPDVGNHTRAVLKRMSAGADWKTSSNAVQRASPSSAGNGSVMRCAPIALWDWNDASLRAEHSRVQSEITHAHQECQWSCALVNSFIAHAMTTGVRDAALDRALAECRDAPGHIRKRMGVAAGKSRAELNPTGYVLDTVDCAIWSLMNSYSFEEALIEAVNLGGDADTTGAVCGALAGAFYGESDIPARWLEPLQDRARIAALADKLAQRQDF
jgi:ADP-ribosyl-[dinitrogen reductase] hydrolase